MYHFSNRQISRILLINPPFHYFPGFVAKATNYVRIPTGICYLASYLREKNGVDVKIIDASAFGLTVEDLKREINDFYPDLVGITVSTPAVNTVHRLITIIRQIKPGAKIVVGGPHITAMPSEFVGSADISVIGEGEETLSELVSCIENGQNISDIPGTALMENSKIKINPRRKFIEDLDALPFPALDLLDLTKYSHIYPYKNGHLVASVFTSRGCPYNCHFCGNGLLWNGTVRYRSIDNVIDEIKYFKHALGIKLFILDDDLFGPEKRVREFCEKIIDNDMNIQWTCHMRCDSVSRETLLMMKRGGCLEIQVGIESADNGVLKAANKKLSNEQIRLFFKNAQGTGVNTYATFILGLYGDNERTIRKSISLAKELDPTFVTFIHLLPLPGTQIFKDYLEKGYIKTYDWSQYIWHGDPIIETDTLSFRDLIRLKKIAYFKFYVRPKKIIQYASQLIKTHSLKIMLRNFMLVLKFCLNI